MNKAAPAFAVCTLIANASNAQLQAVTEILRTGHPILGDPSGRQFSEVINGTRIMLGEGGTVLGAGTLVDPQTSNSVDGLFTIGREDSARFVLVEGEPFIGSAAQFTPTQLQYSEVTTSPNGILGGVATITGDGVDFLSENALFAIDGGATSFIARTGSIAPSTSGQLEFFEFATESISLNRRGRGAFRATLSERINDFVSLPVSSGLFAQNSVGQLEQIASPDTQAPGFDSGTLIGGFDGGTRILDDGSVFYSGQIYGDDVTFDTRKVTWRTGPDGINSERLFQSGVQAPGFAAGVTWTGAVVGTTGFALNDAGQFAFASTITGLGSPSLSRTALFTGTNAQDIRPVTDTSQQAPGLADGVRFGRFDIVKINQNGDIAFHALLVEDDLSQPASGSLFADFGKGVEPVLTAGMNVPGSNGQQETIGFVGFQFAFNARGQFLATASLDRFLFPQDAIYAIDEHRNITLLAMVGEPLLIDGVDESMSDLVVSGLSQTTLLLDDSGLAVFNVEFTNGQEGVFTWQVPSPGSGGLLTLACLAHARRRRENSTTTHSRSSEAAARRHPVGG